MFTRRGVMLGLVSSLLVVGASLHSAPASAAQSCLFDKYRPESATPYIVEESAGYDMYSEMKGVQLYIPAQEGLTRQWLELTLERALLNAADASGAQACHLTVKPTKVLVTSAGDGFWVQLVGHDERDGKQLLNWATKVVQEETAREAAKK